MSKLIALCYQILQLHKDPKQLGTRSTDFSIPLAIFSGQLAPELKKLQDGFGTPLKVHFLNVGEGVFATVKTKTVCITPYIY